MDLRWQGLPARVPKTGDVAATVQLVKLVELKNVLPEGTKYVSAKERVQQLRQRATAYARRYPEDYKD